MTHHLDQPPWHLDRPLAQAYAAGRTDPVLTASVEQHVMACAECRATIGELVDPAALGRAWAEVRERIERPRPRPLEWLLLRFGVDQVTARLLALTPSLRGAWLGGVVLVLCLALIAAGSDPHGFVVFLAVAPVLPAVGVAFAFGPAADPSHEIASAAPYSSLRLLAVRTALVVATTLVPAAATGVLLSRDAWQAAAWLLPALALSGATLAVGARVPPVHTVTVLGGAWVVLALSGLHPHGDPALVAEPAVQLGCLAVLLTSCAWLVGYRRDLPELIRRLG